MVAGVLEESTRGESKGDGYGGGGKLDMANDCGD
jgi:hypothetical protein